MEPGEGLAILKYEASTSDQAFNLDGDRYDAIPRVDQAVSLYAEYGVTERMTLQGKAAWTWGEDDGGGAYSGHGPLELGVRYTLFHRGDTAVALYLGAVVNGDGRNAGYAEPGVGQTDSEARLLAGRSFGLFGKPAFVEGQLARLRRTDLPDETRLDLTAGFEPADKWLVLVQSYAGKTDAEPQWLKMEVSAVRRFGDWRLQAGWRGSVSGKAGPAEAGPVLGVWRSF